MTGEKTTTEEDERFQLLTQLQGKGSDKKPVQWTLEETERSLMASFKIRKMPLTL